MPPSNMKGLWISSASQVQGVELRGEIKKKKSALSALTPVGIEYFQVFLYSSDKTDT